MDSGIELRRYLPLVALEDMLRDRRLRLTRVDQFEDIFEGSVPKQQIDDQVPIFSSANAMLMMGECTAAQYPGMATPPRIYRDGFALMEIRRRAATRSAHASCWTAGPESEGMWRLYCEDGARGLGVSLRSTLGKVEASVEAHDLFVSPVTYRYYHEGPAFNDEIDPFMHKRLGFKHEGEVRLLKYDAPHQRVLAWALTGGDRYAPVPAPPPELPERIFLAWNALEVADAITVSPYATADYEKQVRTAVAAIDPAAADLIELSVLSERRYAALF